MSAKMASSRSPTFALIPTTLSAAADPGIGPDDRIVEVIAAIVPVEHCPPSMPDLLAKVILRGRAGPVQLIFLHGKTAGICGVLLPCGVMTLGKIFFDCRLALVVTAVTIAGHG